MSISMAELKWKKISNQVSKALKFSTICLGITFFLMLVISFTTLPYWAIYDLAVSESDFDFEPEVIVLMGGAGMPSQTALIRTYHTAQLAKQFPTASIVIALPDDLSKEDGHLKGMEDELLLRGVKSKVLFENEGTNTRSQVLLIKELLRNEIEKKIVVVSSPEHIYRSIKSFEKIGFVNVGGYPAFENDIEQSLSFDYEKIGGVKYLPDVGDNNQLRYQFWNHLKYEIILLREYSAILYYKVQRWI